MRSSIHFKWNFTMFHSIFVQIAKKRMGSIICDRFIRINECMLRKAKHMKKNARFWNRNAHWRYKARKLSEIHHTCTNDEHIIRNFKTNTINLAMKYEYEFESTLKAMSLTFFPPTTNTDLCSCDLCLFGSIANKTISDVYTAHIRV